jgi:hypothetical protein
MDGLYWALQVTYLFLPAIAANMAPPWKVVRLFPGGIPIAPAVLGAHKTYRGVVAAIVVATVITNVQSLLYDSFEFFRTFSLYGNHNPFLMGFLFGFGAMAGDAAESLIMRRLNVAPGTPRRSDTFDYLLGAAACVAFVVPLGLREVMFMVAGGLFLHAPIKQFFIHRGMSQDGPDKKTQ